MKLNINKCKVLSIAHNKNDILDYDYTIGDCISDVVKLEHVSSITDLGVIIITSNLSFSEHIYSKINVANKMLGLIKRNFINLDKASFLSVYKSVVRCHLEYAHSVWSPYHKGLIFDLEKVQKRATKLVEECKKMSYIDRLKYLNLPTLKYRRIRGDMIEVFKIVNNYYDSLVVPNLEVSSENRNR